MSLMDYEVDRDSFEYGDDFYNADFDFPCCVCKWNQCDCAGPPCTTCDHNVQAVPDKPNVSGESRGIPRTIDPVVGNS